MRFRGACEQRLIMWPPLLNDLYVDGSKPIRVDLL